MCTLSRNLLCKNIYTMSLFMWSNELFSILKWWLYLYCIFVFSFLTYEVSYSKKNKKFLEENAESIFTIDLSKTVFSGSNFVISGQTHKTSSRIIYSTTIYDHKNFCPQGKWTSYYQICLNTRKIPKFW